MQLISVNVGLPREVTWKEMIDRMIAIVPADTGKVRNVCPQFVEDMLKEAQAAAWTAEI
jgi:hypothetical protein